MRINNPGLPFKKMGPNFSIDDSKPHFPRFKIMLLWFFMVFDPILSIKDRLSSIIQPNRTQFDYFCLYKKTL